MCLVFAFYFCSAYKEFKKRETKFFPFPFLTSFNVKHTSRVKLERKSPDKDRMGGNISSVPVEPYWHTARALNGYRNAHKMEEKWHSSATFQPYNILS